MDSAANSTRYVKLPREEAATPELSPELYKLFKRMFYGELTERFVKLADAYNPSFSLDIVKGLNILLANDDTWQSFTNQIPQKIEENELMKKQKMEQMHTEALMKAVAQVIYYGDHIEKKIVQNEVGHVESGGSGIIVNNPT